MDRASPLRGLTVLVTGGGRGIGRACTLSCARAGARVIAVARTRCDLEEVMSEAAGRLEIRQADVTEPDFWHELGSMSDIDVLVNNAGTNRLQAITDVDDATLDQLLTLNVRSAFKISQAAAKSMIARRRGGSIIHISSLNGMDRPRSRPTSEHACGALEGGPRHATQV